MSDSMPEPGTAAGTVPGSEAEVPSGGGAAPAAGAPLDPAAPAPLGVARTPTGNAGVDAELERLADADHLPADGHIEVYEDVHRGLRETLTALDARPAPAPVPAPMPPHNNRS
ncbi:hypothetical protein [Streptomyces sp. NBC_01363]|uniref:hypothetical protein n=1 Tax=Streptomyces sp. NBC_01363 TaxID=2903840 RepID=UPI0022539416|nr:hypothetical protein [Streptomyces sp. NBC_01363]MCX4732944.1 hypothetical protein [Streptomyces sp. NBC_01363]